MLEIQTKAHRARSKFSENVEAQPVRHRPTPSRVEVTLGRRCRARPAGTAGGNAAGLSNPLGVLRGPPARIPQGRNRNPSSEPQDMLEGLIRQPPRTTTHITLPAVVERADHAPRAGHALVLARAVHARRCRPLPLRGPQGPATGHRRQRAGTDPVPGRRGSGLVPGHVGALRCPGKRAGLRRRLPVPSRPGAVLQGPRRRAVRDRDQGRDLPRPSRFRLSHQPGRASLHYGRFPAGRPGRDRNHRQALRLEPADRHADDGRQGHDAGHSSAFGAQGRDDLQHDAVCSSIPCRNASNRSPTIRRKPPRRSRCR